MALRQAPGTVVPHQIHLKETILGMDESEPESRIAIVLCLDRRDAVSVANDTDLGRRPRQHQPPRRDGQG